MRLRKIWNVLSLPELVESDQDFAIDLINAYNASARGCSVDTARRLHHRIIELVAKGCMFERIRIDALQKVANKIG